MSWLEWIVPGAKFWMRHEIGRKLFPKITARRDAKRAARKAEREAAGGEFFQPDEDVMSETTKSFLRSLLKLAAGALVTKGVIDAGQSDAAVVAIEAIIGGGAGIYALWLSHKKHAE